MCSSSRLANIHTYRAGVSTSCDFALRPAAAHSLSYISEECTGLRRNSSGDRFQFWHELNELGPNVRQHGCYNWDEIPMVRKKTREYKQQAEGELDET